MDTKGFEGKNALNIGFKQNSFFQKAVVILATVFFIFSGVPMPTSFAAVNQPVLNESNQPVPTVTLEQANAASPTTDAPVPSGAPIPTDNPLSSVTSAAVPEDPEFRETIYILPTTQAESRADIDSFMELLAAKGITSITRDQVEALRPAQTDTMHISGGAYYLSQNGSQIAAAFSATAEYGQMVDVPVYAGIVIPQWQSSSISYFSNILYSASPDSDPVVINKHACVAHMGFTEDGLLAFEGDHGGSVAYNSEGEVVAFANDVVELRSVPSGWTVAASNVNYAFRVEYTNSYSHLKLLDLKTNTEKTLRSVWVGGQNPVRFVGNYDVSPDGSTVIYETTETGYRNIITLMRIGNPGKQLRVWGPLESISFERDGQIAVIAVKDVSEPFIVDLQTFENVWTRAASNVNFAFRMESVLHPSDPQRVLYLMDLRTGEQREIARAHVASGNDISDVYDVSPDGEFVIYETSGEYGILVDPEMPIGRRCTVHIQSMSDPSQTIELGDYIGYGYGDPHGELSLKSIQFEGDIVRITRKRLDVTTIVEVNLETGVVRPGVPSGWTRAASNVNFAFREVQIGSQVALNLMDLVKNSVIEVGRIDVGGGYPANFDSYDVLLDGKAVIWGSTRVPYGSSTYLRKLDGSTELSPELMLAGRVTASDYDASAQILKLSLENTSLNNPSWNTRMVFVDIATMTETVPPVPEGWTRASSNANFAFKIETSGHYIRLYLMNLATGEAKELIKAFQSRFSPVPISSVYDVSPDGTTVVYGTASRTYVQTIASPSRKLALSGAPRGIVFDGQIVEITKTNGTRQWVNISILKVVPRPIPSGWTAVPSIANLAYQVISGNKVRVMNLETREVSEKPSSQSQSGVRTGQYYLMTATGLKEIYSVRTSRENVLRSYDPVKKKWAYYKAS